MKSYDTLLNIQQDKTTEFGYVPYGHSTSTHSKKHHEGHVKALIKQGLLEPCGETFLWNGYQECPLYQISQKGKEKVATLPQKTDEQEMREWLRVNRLCSSFDWPAEKERRSQETKGGL